MSLKRFFLFSIILLLILSDGCKCGSKSTESVAPSVSPFEVKVVMGENPTHPADFTFTIDITGAVNTAGIYFRLNYDPEIIQIKTKSDPVSSVTKGTFFHQDGVSDEMLVNFLDQDPGSGCLIIGLSRLPGNPGINGSGTICTFNFTTITAGSATVKFSETVEENALYTPESPLLSIPSVKWTNGEVTVK